ncbi:MAG: metallophosphoesterase family protein [Deltaproteobacteria bacterium]|nr:metallophosphoesterase family protein [Deltaproteobacteria bacterium]
MNTYFFGDIHGNYFALEAVIQHYRQIQPDSVYCLGDLVGWLPFGDKTLTRMRSLNLPTVAGNHDLMVAGLFSDHPHQLDRMQASAYNSGLLSTLPGALEYLLSLPLSIETAEMVILHHSPFHLPGPGMTPSITYFNYLDEAVLLGCLEAWRSFPKKLIFSGHDHIPTVYELLETKGMPTLKDVLIYKPDAGKSLTISLNPGSRYWIKAGSVGGPYRDDVFAANSVLLDSSAQTLTLFRIPYTLVHTGSAASGSCGKSLLPKS